MFAKVRGNNSIRTALYYNDLKVKAGKAEIIHAANFIKNANELSKKEVLERFDWRIALNSRTIKPVAHISVGFKHTDELSNDKMKMLADLYMERIGFGEQPYLVYRHYDVTQPHMHIVATNIREDGGRIELRDIIFWKSRQVADGLADEFSLARSEAADIKQKAMFEVKRAQAVDYGKMPTQRAISDVLNTVIEHYKYNSLGALNAGLRGYNVTVYGGSASSNLRKVGGLLYQALNDKGRRIGSPIKASRFFLKPTLKYLEKKFAENRKQMEGYRQRVETAVDWTMHGKGVSWDRFHQKMEREGIGVVVQRPAKDEPEEVYFVDHREKVIFSGEELGSQYSLAVLRQKCVQGPEQEETQAHRHHLRIRL